MLHGRASREDYALFLRNLLPAYRALEDGLARDEPRLAPLAVPALYRAATIERDLAALLGHRVAWPTLLPAGADYAARVAGAAPPRLMAHAYVRYLGDLSGGQILARLLARSPGLPRDALGFYEFPAITDTAAFRDSYRQAIDRVPLSMEEQEMVLDEACLAFEHNIRLSVEVSAAGLG